jgi:hypothetical protein
VYANFCFALVDVQRFGAAAAFPHLLRAALHWVSSDVPEALPRRAQWAILGSVPDAGEDRTEAVSAALHSRLLATAREAFGISTEPSDVAPAPVFRRGDLPGPVDRIVGSTEFSLLVARDAAAPTFDGPEHQRLRRLLFALVTRLVPEARLSGSDAFIIDDRCGREMALTPREIAETAIRVGAPKMIIGGRCFAIDQPLSDTLERASCVRRGHAVKRIDAYDRRAYFRRCLPPFTLSEAEDRVVGTIDDAPKLGDLALRLGSSVDALRDVVRKLERCRIVTLDLPEDLANPQMIGMRC